VARANLERDHSFSSKRRKKLDSYERAMGLPGDSVDLWVESYERQTEDDNGMDYVVRCWSGSLQQTTSTARRDNDEMRRLRYIMELDGGWRYYVSLA